MPATAVGRRRKEPHDGWRDSSLLPAVHQVQYFRPFKGDAGFSFDTALSCFGISFSSIPFRASRESNALQRTLFFFAVHFPHLRSHEIDGRSIRNPFFLTASSRESSIPRKLLIFLMPGISRNGIPKVPVEFRTCRWNSESVYGTYVRDSEDFLPVPTRWYYFYPFSKYPTTANRKYPRSLSF